MFLGLLSLRRLLLSSMWSTSRLGLPYFFNRFVSVFCLVHIVDQRRVRHANADILWQVAGCNTRAVWCSSPVRAGWSAAAVGEGPGRYERHHSGCDQPRAVATPHFQNVSLHRVSRVPFGVTGAFLTAVLRV